MRLFQNQSSANCYKVELALHHLGIPFERVEVGLVPFDQRPPELLELNPGGRVPFLELEPGFGMGESGAILVTLAEGSALYPAERRARAEVLRWMFFEQNHHEPNIATSRYWLALSGRPEERAAVLPLWRSNGIWALEQMERHLAEHDFFAAGRLTIADIALYGYTHVAPEGGFDLEPYPALRAWLARVAEQPGHVPMSADSRQ